MWNFFYKLASPKWFYYHSGSWLRMFFIPSALILIASLIWGLFFTPLDYQQKEAFKIIYVHVPAAFLSMLLFASLGFLSILVLVWRIKLAGIMLSAIPMVGATMAGLALLTGSLWGKPMWGTWWIWDARLTSELILLFLYLTIITLRHAIGHSEKGDRIVAIFCLIGLVDLPVIHYSVYWWNSLHQGATLTLFSKPKIAPVMLYPLLAALFGFSICCAMLILMRARFLLLPRFYKQKWVQTALQQEAP